MKLGALFSETNTAETALDVLRRDHAALKALFQDFKNATDETARHSIAMTATRELKAHAAVEEKFFYPAVRRSRNDEETHDLVDEAREEHHAAKLLIAELERMKAGESALKAKFTVLTEMVKHHIAEEEGEMFPLARVGSLDLLKLGQEMKHAKARFFRNGGEAKRPGRTRPARGRRARRRATAKAGARRS